MANGNPYGALAGGTPPSEDDQVAQAQKVVDANPWMWKALASVLPGHGPIDTAGIARLRQFQQQTGFKLPEDYSVNANSGKLEKNPGIGTYLMEAGIAAAAPLTAGLLLPALGIGAGVGAAAGAGATAAGGAGATAAGVAGAVGASAPSWLGPAIGAGISTVGGIIGGKIQAGATEEAARLQKEYLDQALAYEKERDAYARGEEAKRYGYLTSEEANRYGTLQRQEAPFIATGTSANARMASLLGLPTPSAPAVPQSGGTAPSIGPAPYPTGAPSPSLGDASLAGRPAASTITMQAPDGSTKQVPADQEQHWVTQGARRVG